MLRLSAHPWGLPWDDGITWRVENGTPTDWLISPADVTKRVLRVVNDDEDDEYVESCIRAAIGMAEQHTARSIAPRTRTLILSGFPGGRIQLPYPPLREVVSFGYTGPDGDALVLGGSPAEYLLSLAGQYVPASLSPLYGASWPSARDQADAVTITYTAGYETQDDIPPSILHGIYAVVGELYETRSLKVSGTTVIPSPLQLERFWPRVY